MRHLQSRLVDHILDRLAVQLLAMALVDAKGAGNVAPAGIPSAKLVAVGGMFHTSQ
jgi:hypothetical protein